MSEPRLEVPVTCLIYLKKCSAVLDRISNSLCEHFDFQPVSHWNLTCKLYRSTLPVNYGRAGDDLQEIEGDPALGSILYFLVSSHRPGKSWCAISSGKKTAIVEALGSYSFETIISSKCEALWFMRQAASIKGRVFACGNYRVRIGILSFGDTPRGIGMQVENTLCPKNMIQKELVSMKKFVMQVLRKVPDITEEELYDALNNTGNAENKTGTEEGTSREASKDAPKDESLGPFNRENFPEMCTYSDDIFLDKTDYSSANLKPHEFTSGHEAFQIFSLLNTAIS